MATRHWLYRPAIMALSLLLLACGLVAMTAIKLALAFVVCWFMELI